MNSEYRNRNLSSSSNMLQVRLSHLIPSGYDQMAYLMFDLGWLVSDEARELMELDCF